MSELPHCLQGALLFNCVLALVISSLLHRSMPPHIRVENALTAFIILDLGKMWADAKATKKGLRRGAFWLAAATMQNLQDLAGSGCFVTYIYIYICIYLPLSHNSSFPDFPSHIFSHIFTDVCYIRLSHDHCDHDDHVQVWHATPLSNATA